MDLSDGENALLEHIKGARERGEVAYPRSEELGIDVEGAYRVQAALGEGREVLGYKLGLIAPAKQAQMGVDSSIYGRIHDGMILESPVRLGPLLQPRIEPELAVVLGEDLAPDASPGAASLAIGGTYLAIDFLSSVWKDYQFAVADVVADNASAGGLLLGERLLGDPLGGNLRLYHSGRLLAEGPVGDTGNVGERLAWLSGAVGGLKAGQAIFLGSPAVAQEAMPGTIELYGPRNSALIADLQD